MKFLRTLYYWICGNPNLETIILSFENFDNQCEIMGIKKNDRIKLRTLFWEYKKGCQFIFRYNKEKDVVLVGVDK